MRIIKYWIFVKFFLIIMVIENAAAIVALASSGKGIQQSSSTDNPHSVFNHPSPPERQFFRGTRIDKPTFRLAQSTTDELAQFGLGSGNWAKQYVMGRIEGATFYTWNTTSSTFSDVEINVSSNNRQVVRRQGRILPPNSNIDLIIPGTPSFVSSCSIGFNRNSGEWVKVVAQFTAPQPNFMRRLQNMESVEFEILDYKVSQLPGRPSCN